jgi:hypothetical protein
MTPIEHVADYLSFTPTALSPASLGEETWERIAITAIALGLAPLLHWKLGQVRIEAPPLTIAKLAVTRKAHAGRNHEIAGQLAELLAACARQNIQGIVLKGALLAETVYAEAALRPMNDIDLLFQPADLPRVSQLLEGLGYIGKHKQADQGPGVTKHLSTYRRNGHEASTPNPYLSAGGERMVEPHGSLEESWFGLKVDITPGVWERARLIQLHGQPAYRLSNPDMLLHLAVHATFHVIMGSSVFVQLYDLGQVIQNWFGEEDWAQLLKLARAAGAQPFVYAALYWARTIYRVPLPAAPLSALEQDCHPALLAYIQELDAKALLHRTQHPPLVTLGQRLKRGLLDRQETARWASSPAKKWKVWQTALAFHKTDTVGLLKRNLKV